jgi:hypothetical protein
MHSYLMVVTPDKAQEWLRTVKEDRLLREKWAQTLSKDMKSGRWMVTPQGIVLDEDGNVIDGQHRLRAVVIAGVPVEFWVTEGAPRETYQVLDGGRSRTLADRLTAIGTPHAPQLAALARRVYCWKTDQPMADRVPATHLELQEVIDTDPLIKKAAVFAHRWRGKPVPTTAAFGWWLFNQVDSEDATWYMERLRDGHELDLGHPILTLRNRLYREHRPGEFVKQQVVAAWMITCWNKYRAGESYGKIQSPSNPWTNNNYPHPR